MNDFDDLDQLKRDVGPGLLTALREVASQIKPEDMPRLDSGEGLMGYVRSPSLERPLPDSPHRAPRRGALVIGAVSVAAAVVAVALFARPTRGASPVQTPTTTAAPTTISTSYLQDIPSGKRTLLPAGLVGGVPSPDGTRVAVVSTCTESPSASGNELSVGDIDGSDLHTIVPPDGRTITHPSWSPDGTKVVYEKLDDPSSPGPPFNELFVVDVATGVRNQLTHGLQFESVWSYESLRPLAPTFTRDGEAVLFMLGSDVWSIPVSAAEPSCWTNSTECRPTVVIEDAAFPAALADGKSVAYVSSGGVWVASIDGSGARRKLVDVPPCCGIRDLSVSPDGTKLLYLRDSGSVDSVDNSGGVARFPITGGVTVVDVATGASEYEGIGPLDRRVQASWLDNDTLFVTE